MSTNITLDDGAPSIRYNPPSAWTDQSTSDCQLYHDATCHVAQAQGASAIITFNGTGIWFYGAQKLGYGIFTIEIDGRQVQRASSSSSFSRPDFLMGGTGGLPMGTHTAVLTAQSNHNQYMDLDYIRVEAPPAVTLSPSPTSVTFFFPASSSSATQASESTAFSQNPSPHHQVIDTRVLAIAISVGLMVSLVITVLITLCLRRRRRLRRGSNTSVDDHVEFGVAELDSASRKTSLVAPSSRQVIDPTLTPNEKVRAIWQDQHAASTPIYDIRGHTRSSMTGTISSRTSAVSLHPRDEKQPHVNATHEPSTGISPGTSFASLRGEPAPSMSVEENADLVRRLEELGPIPQVLGAIQAMMQRDSINAQDVALPRYEDHRETSRQLASIPSAVSSPEESMTV